jgi:FtsZ-binding cell division protein ZapB
MKGSGQTHGGCRIGWMLRDDLALELLKQAIGTLQVNWAEIAAQTAAAIQTVVCLEGEQKTDSISLLTHELDRLTEKKEAVLDAFFSGSISEADMKRMNERYNREQDALQIRLQTVKRHPKTVGTQKLKKQIFDIVNGLTESEAFYKNLLDRLVVFRNGRVEASLNGLSQVWTFQVESNRKKSGPV